jgi:hypothetical protein
MADYYSLIAKAVGALDLNTEKARQRLYDRARTALRSRMLCTYPPFQRSEIAAAELSLQMAIDAVEAEAVVELNAKLATPASSSLRARTPSQPANQNDEAPWSLATLWAGIFRRASDDPPILGEARSGYSGRDTRLTELLARASRGSNNNEQDFAPRRAPTQTGGAN